MKSGNVEQIIRTTYLLEMGIDFHSTDLEIIASNGINELKALNKKFRTETFQKLNIGEIVWSGHFNKETQTVMVKTEKELFV